LTFLITYYTVDTTGRIGIVEDMIKINPIWKPAAILKTRQVFNYLF
jgi:hypothetical protein